MCYFKVYFRLFPVLVASVNAYSVRLASGIQIIFTIAKVLALVIIVIGGIVKLAQGTESWFAVTHIHCRIFF